ncbi:MAG: transglutaminase domain-containing protein [Ruminococcaceae bacterium]|nr:transglutaminase domain-containing protein [Oscillospiraceae bacterium]
MKKSVILIIVLCLLLSGCSNWLNGNYSSVVPHTEPNEQINTPSASIANYFQTKLELISMVKNGTESAVLTILYPSDKDAEADMIKAIDEVCRTDPYAVYAVQGIRYELGTSSGQSAIHVQITYRQNRVDVKTIHAVKDVEEAKLLIAEQLDACSSGVVFYCESWGQPDYAQIVADYALKNPHQVIEEPEVTVNSYPERGMKQIVELKFTYQTSRDSLRVMQSHVAVVFNSAEQSVDPAASEMERHEQLYNFLMNRYSSYEISTSITPAYSLLRHGVGDERAFATVYAAMCGRVGLNCEVVTGTRDGKLWTWNVIEMDGIYYHLDVLRSREAGQFHTYTGEEMTGYVWDYSLYPFAREKIS